MNCVANWVQKSHNIIWKNETENSALNFSFGQMIDADKTGDAQFEDSLNLFMTLNNSAKLCAHNLDPLILTKPNLILKLCKC